MFWSFPYRGWVALFAAVGLTLLLGLYPELRSINRIGAKLLFALAISACLANLILRALTKRAFRNGTLGARATVQRASDAALTEFLAHQAACIGIAWAFVILVHDAFGMTTLGIALTVAGLTIVVLGLLTTMPLDRSPLACLPTLVRLPSSGLGFRSTVLAFSQAERIRLAHRTEFEQATREDRGSRSALLVSADDDPDVGVTIRLPDLASRPSRALIDEWKLRLVGGLAPFGLGFGLGLIVAALIQLPGATAVFENGRGWLEEVGLAPPRIPDPNSLSAAPPRATCAKRKY